MILITGASGFLGQHLVRHVSRQGVQVRALYHSHAPNEEQKRLPGVQWQQCDLLDVYAVEEVMKDVTDIYHCAAIVSFDPKHRDEMLHFNTESTANIVNQALQQEIRKMVHVSSVAALGRTGDAKKEMTEEEEWGESSYNSAYGISKYLAEMEVWRGIGEGLDAVIVNPGIIMGPCDSNSANARLMKMAYEEFPFYTTGVSSFVGVNDVVKAMTLLMKKDITAERFIVSAGNFPFRRIFDMMAKALNKKPPRYKANSFMTSIAWRMSVLKSKITGGKTLITRETMNNATGFSYYNNSRLLQAIPGFTYEPMEETVMRMALAFNQSL